MEAYYNVIKPVGKRVIVAVRDGAKNSHLVETEKGDTIELFVDTSYSWDGKISNHTQATLLTDFKNLKAGTDVLIYHNSISDDNCLDIYPDNLTRIHSIEDNFLYFGFVDGRLECVDGYMVGERVYDEETVSPGGIILTEKKKYDTLIKILAKPDSVTDYEVGDIAVMYKYSDYEMTHNLGGKMEKIIRVKVDDCFGKVTI